MRIYNYDIVLQEVPDEISLCINVCGCPNKCQDCHSKYTWGNTGDEFLIADLKKLLDKYNGYITCVVFMGGEWTAELLPMLKVINTYKIKTCLYTGSDDVLDEIKSQLTFLKTGKFIKENGGLDSTKTNQIFKNLKTNEILNYKFIRNVY